MIKAAGTPRTQSSQHSPLAVADEEPIREPIAIPTAMSEHVDYRIATWYGFLAPAKTPATILAALYDALAELGKDSELRATMHMHGVKPRGIGIREFDLYIRKDVERLTPLLANALAVVFVGIILTAHWLPLGPARGFVRSFIFVALLIGGLLLFFRLFQHFYARILGWCLEHKAAFLSLPVALLLVAAMIWQGFDRVHI